MINMVMFVGEEKMNIVQKALHHARFTLSLLHCYQDTSEDIALIDEALESLVKSPEPDSSP